MGFNSGFKGLTLCTPLLADVEWWKCLVDGRSG